MGMIRRKVLRRKWEFVGSEGCYERTESVLICMGEIFWRGAGMGTALRVGMGQGYVRRA